MKSFYKFMIEMGEQPQQGQPVQQQQPPLGTIPGAPQPNSPQGSPPQQPQPSEQPGGLEEMEKLFSQIGPVFSRHPNAAVQQAYKTFEKAVTSALQTPGTGSAQEMVNKNKPAPQPQRQPHPPQQQQVQ